MKSITAVSLTIVAARRARTGSGKSPGRRRRVGRRVGHGIALPVARRNLTLRRLLTGEVRRAPSADLARAARPSSAAVAPSTM